MHLESVKLVHLFNQAGCITKLNYVAIFSQFVMYVIIKPLTIGGMKLKVTLRYLHSHFSSSAI